MQYKLKDFMESNCKHTMTFTRTIKSSSPGASNAEYWKQLNQLKESYIIQVLLYIENHAHEESQSPKYRKVLMMALLLQSTPKSQAFRCHFGLLVGAERQLAQWFP